MTATLIYKQLSDVLVVPITALHRNASGGQYVEQVKNGKTVQTTVQVGLSSGGQAQITSGLSAGDKIRVPQTPLNRGGNGRTGDERQDGGQLPGGGSFRSGGGQFPVAASCPAAATSRRRHGGLGG